jgi:mannose-6-phosphate isomerase-like protein (cupin superfamily)
MKPWGRYKLLLNLKFFKIKKLTLNPHSSFSLQKHFRRAELWFLFSGDFFVRIYSIKYSLETSLKRIFYIRKESIHRLTNCGDKAFSFIEFQFGNCEEEDIERFEDDYDRL